MEYKDSVGDILDWLEKIKEDLKRAKVITYSAYGASYRYMVNPLSSGVPEIHSEALWGCAYEIVKAADIKFANKILAPEAMGIHLAAAVSMVTGLPFLVARKISYELPGEIEVVKRTGYAESKLYINHVNPGDKVLLVDSIIATGGTISAIIKALEANKVEVVDIVVVIERKEFNGVERVRKETGKQVKTLIKTVIKDKHVEVC